MTTVRIDYFGVEGEGRNVTEAKRNAGHKIEQAMRGSYVPRVLVAGDDAVVIFRTPQHWEYGFIRDGNLCSIQGASEDRDDVERAARRHLGANATDWRTCLTVADVHPIVVEPADRREILVRCDWQRKYHAWRELGMEDNDARNAIGGFTQFLSEDGKRIYAGDALLVA